MAKPDWEALQKRFLSDHAETGVSPKEWCEAQGLNYATAKRHIKIANSRKGAKKENANSQIEKCAEELANNDVLTAQIKEFIVEYLKDNNATKAAKRAGYSDPNYGRQLLTNPNVAQEIARQQKASLSRTIGSADDVLRTMWDIATVDGNEITQYRRGCCRRCWGVGHKYQWTEDEYEEACEKAEMRDKPIPDCSGGLDYMRTRDPNPECPHCGGEGVGRVFMQDTRKLSGIARMAYSGVKVTKGGIEITTLDRQRMFEAIAKRMGLMDSEIAQKLQQLELERRELELEKLRRELNDGKDDLPIDEMEVTIVGAQNQRNDDGATG